MTAQELRDQFDIDLKKLQEECLHLETGWAEESWAIGHMTGRQIRYCKVCEKHLEYKGSTWAQEAASQFGVDSFDTLNSLNDEVDLGPGL